MLSSYTNWPGTVISGLIVFSLSQKRAVKNTTAYKLFYLKEMMSSKENILGEIKSRSCFSNVLSYLNGFKAFPFTQRE